MKKQLSEKQKILRELQMIPGVGKSIAEDLWALDIRAVGDLKGKDPERMYGRLCKQYGTHIDRCMLYVLRCAVYYSSAKKHKPDLLLWWNWKDKNI